MKVDNLQEIIDEHEHLEDKTADKTLTNHGQKHNETLSESLISLMVRKLFCYLCQFLCKKDFEIIRSLCSNFHIVF